MCTALVAAWELADGKPVGAAIGGRIEAKCPRRRRLGESWLTAYLWAPALVGGQRPRVHCVDGGCVRVSSLAVGSSVACRWQRPHVTGGGGIGVVGKTEATCPWCRQLRGAWLTANPWALLLVGGRRPHVRAFDGADGLSVGTAVGGRMDPTCARRWWLCGLVLYLLPVTAT